MRKKNLQFSVSFANKLTEIKPNVKTSFMFVQWGETDFRIKQPLHSWSRGTGGVKVAKNNGAI